MALRQSDKHESANAQVFCGAPTRFQTSRIHVKSIAVDVCTERWRYLKGFAASKPVHVPPSADVDSRVTLSLQMENENKKSIKRSNIVRRQFSIEMWFECSQSIQLCQSDTAHQRTIGGTTIRLNFVSIAADARIVCVQCVADVASITPARTRRKSICFYVFPTSNWMRNIFAFRFVGIFSAKSDQVSVSSHSDSRILNSVDCLLWPNMFLCSTYGSSRGLRYRSIHRLMRNEWNDKLIKSIQFQITLCKFNRRSNANSSSKS